jgi:hypothetical protein
MLCITLNDLTFSIDLIPMKLGSFDIIVGMDWLSKHHAQILCLEKCIRITHPSGTILKVFGNSPSGSIRRKSCTQACNSLHKGSIFLFSQTTQETKSVELRGTLIVRDFSDVFPDDLPGLPPVRAVEFQIDLVPNTTPVAKLPYCLAPSEIQELSIPIKPGSPSVRKSICRPPD